MTKLVKYDAARKALAAAVRVDEVIKIRNQAIALQVYAKQAKDGQLIAHATEIKERATRKLGEKMAAQPKAKGGKPYQGKSTGPARGPVATLNDNGIDKKLAERARAAAAMSDEQFEANVEQKVQTAVAAAEGDKAVISAARERRHKAKKKQRAEKEQALAEKIAALPTKRYGVIVADPEWRFEFWSENGKTNSSADNHYPTSALDAIKQRDIASISADDCVLFLWATVPMLPHALEVMDAWGFRYVSNFTWGKNKAGTGYWSRNKHEHLLIGVRGKPPAPAPGMQFESLIVAPVGAHSEKPEVFLEMVETYFPTLPKIELNRRGLARPGWDAWGNEVDDDAPPATEVRPTESAAHQAL